MKHLLFGRAAVAVALAGIFVAASQANAQTPVRDPYDAGVYLLKSGKWFERAVNRLNEAATAKSDDSRVRLALGCAKASRAASLAYAAYFTEELAGNIRDYPQELADWETAQKDPESDEYNTERPIRSAPFTFWTKDDNRPYRLTPKQVRARVDELSEAATDDWDKARELAATDDERAEADYVRGWGLLLLDKHRLEPTADENAAAEKTPASESDEEEDDDAPAPPSARVTEARKALEEAVKLAPENALYWQSLGDVLLNGVVSSGALKDNAPARAAYQKSLDLEPRNPLLSYLLYQAAARTLTFDPAPENEERRARARTYLLNAAKSDAMNGFFWYQLAALDLRATPYWKVLNKPATEREQAFADVLAGATEADRKTARNAITLLERANAVPRYAAVRYQPAVPALLARAWDYTARFAYFFDEGSGFRELARNAAGYAQVSARENRTGDAVRAARVVIGMGYRLIGDWPTKDKTPGDNTLITSLVGAAIAAIGHDTLVKVYDQVGDEAGRRQAEAAQNALKQRRAVLQEVLEAELARPDHESY